MESGTYIIDEIKFIPRSSLSIQLTALHRGEPDGGIGIPLIVTKDSSKYLVNFERAGRFRVLSEAFNELKKPYEKINNFLYGMLDSKYLREHESSAKIFTNIPFDAEIKHYMVYSEFFVVDVLASEPPIIEVVENNQ